MPLPPDSHVHSEWSWDAQYGGMEQTCVQALRLGLPAVAFTEHLDHTVWMPSREGLAGLPPDHPVAALTDAEGRLAPPPFEVSGYLEALDRCRTSFPDLRILSGLELGEPHWHAEKVDAVLAAGDFDRVLGSLHCLPDGDTFREPNDLYTHREAGQVVRDYLAELTRLVTQSEVFSVVAHIDYPVRDWPVAWGRFDAEQFEEEFRHTLRTIAGSGWALEISTVVPLSETVLRWWYDVGGQAVTFGSDAHEPSEVARGFADAAAMAEAHGFSTSDDRFGPWLR